MGDGNIETPNNISLLPVSAQSAEGDLFKAKIINNSEQKFCNFITKKNSGQVNKGSNDFIRCQKAQQL